MTSLVIARRSPKATDEAIPMLSAAPLHSTGLLRSPRRPRNDVEVRLDGKTAGVRKRWARQIVTKTLRLEKAFRARVSVWVTGNRQIRAVNKKHLSHDYATDVIAFVLQGRPLLGDIVVSAQMARAVSKRLGIPMREELARYLVHGALHLLGYDDRTTKERRRMHERQERILQSLRGGRLAATDEAI